MSAKWMTARISDQTGSSAVVTGANSGLGLGGRATRPWEASEQLAGVKFELAG